MYSFVYMSTYICIYIYTYTCTHTCIYVIYIYTCICNRQVVYCSSFMSSGGLTYGATSTLSAACMQAAAAMAEQRLRTGSAARKGTDALHSRQEHYNKMGWHSGSIFDAPSLFPVSKKSPCPKSGWRGQLLPLFLLPLMAACVYFTCYEVDASEKPVAALQPKMLRLGRFGKSVQVFDSDGAPKSLN